jgi:Helix-turn-helix domain
VISSAPVDCPPCAASRDMRGRLWQRALKINRAARKRGVRGPQPLTRTTLHVYDHLLWHAPRWTGALFPSAEAIARALTAGERTVRRAIAELARWGLLVVHARWRRWPKPIRLGGQTVGVLRVGCRTSNAYSFPDPAASWPCQVGREPKTISNLYAPHRDSSGRFVPAPMRQWVLQAEAVRQQGTGYGADAPLLVARRRQVEARAWEEAVQKALRRRNGQPSA